MTLIDTEVAAYILKISTRRVQQLVKDGHLTNHGDSRSARLNLAEVSNLAAQRQGD